MPRSKGLDIDLIAKTLPAAAARIKEWVSQATEEEMELILRGVNIQVRASNQEIQIEGSVPVSVEEAGHLVTIAQTSA